MADPKASQHGGQPQPSGPEGTNPSTAGKDKTSVRSHTPENRVHAINPSSPNDAVTAPSRQAVDSDSNDNNPL